MPQHCSSPEMRSSPPVVREATFQNTGENIHDGPVQPRRTTIGASESFKKEGAEAHSHSTRQLKKTRKPPSKPTSPNPNLTFASTPPNTPGKGAHPCDTSQVPLLTPPPKHMCSTFSGEPKHAHARPDEPHQVHSHNCPRYH